MKIDRLKPGQILYDVTREHMGKTLVRTVAVREVVITWLDSVTGSCSLSKCFGASWNGNESRTYRSVPVNWKLRKPYRIGPGLMGSYRLATKEERAAGGFIENRLSFDRRPR